MHTAVPRPLAMFPQPSYAMEAADSTTAAAHGQQAVASFFARNDEDQQSRASSQVELEVFDSAWARIQNWTPPSQEACAHFAQLGAVWTAVGSASSNSSGFGKGINLVERVYAATISAKIAVIVQALQYSYTLGAFRDAVEDILSKAHPMDEAEERVMSFQLIQRAFNRKLRMRDPEGTDSLIDLISETHALWKTHNRRVFWSDAIKCMVSNSYDIPHSRLRALNSCTHAVDKAFKSITGVTFHEDDSFLADFLNKAWNKALTNSCNAREIKASWPPHPLSGNHWPWQSAANADRSLGPASRSPGHGVIGSYTFVTTAADDEGGFSSQPNHLETGFHLPTDYMLDSGLDGMEPAVGDVQQHFSKVYNHSVDHDPNMHLGTNATDTLGLDMPVTNSPVNLFFLPVQNPGDSMQHESSITCTAEEELVGDPGPILFPVIEQLDVQAVSVSAAPESDMLHAASPEKARAEWIYGLFFVTRFLLDETITVKRNLKSKKCPVPSNVWEDTELLAHFVMQWKDPVVESTHPTDLNEGGSDIHSFQATTPWRMDIGPDSFSDTYRLGRALCTKLSTTRADLLSTAHVHADLNSDSEHIHVHTADPYFKAAKCMSVLDSPILNDTLRMSMWNLSVHISNIYLCECRCSPSDNLQSLILRIEGALPALLQMLTAETKHLSGSERPITTIHERCLSAFACLAFHIFLVQTAYGTRMQHPAKEHLRLPCMTVACQFLLVHLLPVRDLEFALEGFTLLELCGFQTASLLLEWRQHRCKNVYAASSDVSPPQFASFISTLPSTSKAFSESVVGARIRAALAATPINIQMTAHLNAIVCMLAFASKVPLQELVPATNDGDYTCRSSRNDGDTNDQPVTAQSADSDAASAAASEEDFEHDHGRKQLDKDQDHRAVGHPRTPPTIPKKAKRVRQAAAVSAEAPVCLQATAGLAMSSEISPIQADMHDLHSLHKMLQDMVHLKGRPAPDTNHEFVKQVFFTESSEFFLPYHKEVLLYIHDRNRPVHVLISRKDQQSFEAALHPELQELRDFSCFAEPVSPRSGGKRRKATVVIMSLGWVSLGYKAEGTVTGRDSTGMSTTNDSSCPAIAPAGAVMRPTSRITVGASSKPSATLEIQSEDWSSEYRPHLIDGKWEALEAQLLHHCAVIMKQDGIKMNGHHDHSEGHDAMHPEYNNRVYLADISESRFFPKDGGSSNKSEHGFFLPVFQTKLAPLLYDSNMTAEEVKHVRNAQSGSRHEFLLLRRLRLRWALQQRRKVCEGENAFSPTKKVHAFYLDEMRAHLRNICLLSSVEFEGVMSTFLYVKVGFQFFNLHVEQVGFPFAHYLYEGQMLWLFIPSGQESELYYMLWRMYRIHYSPTAQLRNDEQALLGRALLYSKMSFVTPSILSHFGIRFTIHTQSSASLMTGPGLWAHAGFSTTVGRTIGLATSIVTDKWLKKGLPAITDFFQFATKLHKLYMQHGVALGAPNKHFTDGINGAFIPPSTTVLALAVTNCPSNFCCSLLRGLLADLHCLKNGLPSICEYPSIVLSANGDQTLPCSSRAVQESIHQHQQAAQEAFAAIHMARCSIGALISADISGTRKCRCQDHFAHVAADSFNESHAPGCSLCSCTTSPEDWTLAAAEDAKQLAALHVDLEIDLHVPTTIQLVVGSTELDICTVAAVSGSIVADTLHSVSRSPLKHNHDQRESVWLQGVLRRFGLTLHLSPQDGNCIFTSIVNASQAEGITSALKLTPLQARHQVVEWLLENSKLWYHWIGGTTLSHDHTVSLSAASSTATGETESVGLQLNEFIGILDWSSFYHEEDGLPTKVLSLRDAVNSLRQPNTWNLRVVSQWSQEEQQELEALHNKRTQLFGSKIQKKGSRSKSKLKERAEFLRSVANWKSRNLSAYQDNVLTDVAMEFAPRIFHIPMCFIMTTSDARKIDPALYKPRRISCCEQADHVNQRSIWLVQNSLSSHWDYALSGSNIQLDSSGRELRKRNSQLMGADHNSAAAEVAETTAKRQRSNVID